MKYSLKGWSLGKFIRGRDKLIIALVGGITSYLITNNPATAGIVGGVAELVYSVIRYYMKE